jgi:hypothetical protein
MCGAYNIYVRRNACRILVRKFRDHSEGLGTDGKIISEWVLAKQSGKI